MALVIYVLKNSFNLKINKFKDDFPLGALYLSEMAPGVRMFSL